MEKSTKMVMVLALMLVTIVVSLEARKLKAEEPKYEPQTFLGFHWGRGTGVGFIPGFRLGWPAFGGGSRLVPGIGLGRPAFGGGSRLVPGIGFGSNPLIPGGGFRGVPGADQP